MKKAWVLDLHGVINSAPEFFALVTNSLVKDGWEIHVLTGSHIAEKGIEEELKSYGIAYTHLFSIADYHRNNKESMFYDEKGDPWISDEAWDRTKADYCERNEIPMCTDDTARYAKYFDKCAFSYMTIQKNGKEPNKYLNLIIDMFNKKRESSDKIKGVKNQMIQKTPLNIPLAKISKWKNWAYDFLHYFMSPPDKLGKER